MQKRPQLSQVVLKRCASQQEPAMGLEVEKYLPSLRLKVFNVLSLVKNHIIPFLSSENRVVCNSNFIACNADMKTI